MNMTFASYLLDHLRPLRLPVFVALPDRLIHLLFQRGAQAFLASAALLLFLLGNCSNAVGASRVKNGLQALYLFDEGGGSTIHDRSGSDNPLDLRIENENAVRWQPGSLQVHSPTVIRSLTRAEKLIDAVKKSNAVTVEVWLANKSLAQKGPARIVSLSANASSRNMTLGQEGAKYDVRLRTTDTDRNGIPSTGTDEQSVATELTHVVYTREPGGIARFFLNGNLHADRKRAGDFSPWDSGYHLSLANEQDGGRPWLGELHLVAIYDRALDADEIKSNFQARATAELNPQVLQQLAREDAEHEFAMEVAPLLARKCLDCHDAAGKQGGLDLSRRGSALQGGDSGPAMVVGNAAESLLWELVSAGDMPPEGPPLSKEDKAVLKRWIDKGAVWSIDQIDPAVYASNAAVSESWVQRLTIAEYIETVRSTTSVDISKEARELLPPDLRADGFSNTAYNLNVDLKHIEAYSQLAQIIVDRMDVLEFAGQFSKSRSLNTDATARKFVESVGEWLLRGPLDRREVANYSGILTAVASAGGTFEDGAALMTEAMLQSPRFIYRIEQQRGNGRARSAGPFELASRMSYIIWGGPPDRQLFKAARDGRLSDPEYCRKQVERMLNDPRAIARSKQFIIDWLDLDRLYHMRPNSERFPEWKPELGVDMRDETLAFFEEIAWKEKRPLSDLFNAQFTYATPRLAQHYGLEPVGEGMQRYDLSNVSHRGGLLTQGSVLTVGGEDASMVTCGLFVLQDVLRGIIGAPPPGVDTTPKPAEPGLTLRTLAEQRINNASCGGCHKRFEPLAFGLEKFDGLGKFQDHDEFGNELQEAGQILIPGEAEPESYQTSAELMDLLAGSDRVEETITWKVTQFALGRPLGGRDASELQRIREVAHAEGGTYPALITAIIMSDLVQKTYTQSSD